MSSTKASRKSATDYERENRLQIKRQQEENRRRKSEEEERAAAERELFKLEQFKKVKSKIAQDIAGGSGGGSARSDRDDAAAERHREFLRRGTRETRAEAMRAIHVMERYDTSAMPTPGGSGGVDAYDTSAMSTPGGGGSVDESPCESRRGSAGSGAGHKKPQVPRHEDTAQLAPRSTINFIASNRAEAETLKPPAKNDTPEVFRHRSQGAVPSYLLARKLQWAKEEARRRADAPDPDAPRGMVAMPEAERLETLALLRESGADAEKQMLALLHESGADAEKQRAVLVLWHCGQGHKVTRAQLARMPLVVQTPSMRRRRDDLEARLSEIEAAVALFSRDRVYELEAAAALNTESHAAEAGATAAAPAAAADRAPGAAAADDAAAVPASAAALDTAAVPPAPAVALAPPVDTGFGAIPDSIAPPVDMGRGFGATPNPYVAAAEAPPSTAAAAAAPASTVLPPLIIPFENGTGDCAAAAPSSGAYSAPGFARAPLPPHPSVREMLKYWLVAAVILFAALLAGDVYEMNDLTSM
ncbi:hypothetical protein JKP88DRAFT_352572 [Tribonema minus]|uniref:Enkurin domain-containing protein n=1 Tax=Tribonema minus TaxID=303371 RepID=A0A835ZBP8_9STRA|nr:hypothetical protein JKP88DRAFT_352572 [Tribonema minus]